MNLDRFAYGLPDIQDNPPLGQCWSCGNKIYDGNYATLGICESCDELLDYKEDDKDD